MSATFLTIKKKGLPAQSGFTLVETIIYVVLMTLVMGVIVQMLIAIGGIYRGIKLESELENSGTIAMETMLREIRNASNVSVSESVLGVSPGTLTISGIDENSNPYKVAFNTSAGGAIMVSKNGAAPVALTSSSGAVSYLLFTRITNANSEGVRIELEMSGSSGTASKSERFYGFTVLRGSY
jgi:Tfp pilus assembly protein PilW